MNARLNTRTGINTRTDIETLALEYTRFTQSLTQIHSLRQLTLPKISSMSWFDRESIFCKPERFDRISQLIGSIKYITHRYFKYIRRIECHVIQECFEHSLTSAIRVLSSPPPSRPLTIPAGRSLHIQSHQLLLRRS